MNNEEAMLYIKDCAESVGIKVTEDTAFSIQFIVEVMKKLREREVSHEQMSYSDNMA